MNALTGLRAELERPMPENSKPVHVYQIYVRATPEQLWEMSTSAEFTRRYFHATAIEST